MAITNGRYCVTKGINDDVTISEDLENCEMPYVYTMELANLATTKDVRNAIKL